MSKTQKNRRSFVAEDLSKVVSGMDLSALDHSSLLITGASGFMGIWLTELLDYLAKNRSLNLKLSLLARDFDFAKKEAPHLYEERAGLRIMNDDVRLVHELPQDVEWIIHAAASPDLRVHNSQPILSSQTITQGTYNLLDCATRLPKFRGFLNISSGYVYGYHSAGELIGEKDFEGFDPGTFSTAYAEAKRYAESLCTIFRNQFRLPVVNVRPFSFVGPYQSIDAPWAINNFIHDVVNRQPIRIQGDGSAVRSYMYGADMAWWLLAMLLKGESGRSYNLGDSSAVTLKDLAERIRHLAGDKIDVSYARAQLKSRPSIFAPSIAQARSELGLESKFGLDAALSRTLQWYQLPL